MIRCQIVVPIALCAALLLPLLAHAQRAPDEPGNSQSDRTVAAELTARGASAFRTARYDEAAQLFERAYALAPIAELQFNLGQCYRQLKLTDAARRAFERYLRARPDAPEREQIARWIAEDDAPGLRPAPAPSAAARQSAASDLAAEAALDRTLDQRPQTALPAPAARPSQRDQGESDGPTIFERWWFWTAVGVVAASGVTAAVVLNGGSEPPAAGSLGTVQWN